MTNRNPTAAAPPASQRERLPILRAGIIRLLTVGAVSAPLWAVVVVVQAAVRPGYDITRYPASVLALGSLGWVQTANFLLGGVLTLAYAVGMRTLLRGGRAGTWAPVLLTVSGLGLLVSGAFPLDPGGGFPPEAAAAPPVWSWHAIVHNVGGTLLFIALIAACFVLARRFTAVGDQKWAYAGRVAGVLFTAGLVWVSSGGWAGSLALFLGFVLAWTWVAASGRRLASHVAPNGGD